MVTDSKTMKVDSLIPARYSSMKIDELLVEEVIHPMINEIRSRADEHVDDLSTKKGRDEVVSNAFQATKTKTHFMSIANPHIEKEKKKLESKVSVAKEFCREMDILREEKKKPVVEWEKAEKDRKEKERVRIDMIRENIAIIEEQYSISEGKSSSEIKEIIESVSRVMIDDATYSEFKEEAELVRSKVLDSLNVRLDSAIKQEETARELEKLRKAEANRAVINKKIEDIRDMGAVKSNTESASDVKSQIDMLDNINIDDAFGDQLSFAVEVKVKTMAALTERLELREKAESDAEELRRNAAELAEFRQEKANRAKKEEDKKVINDLFRELGDKHASSFNGMSVSGWEKYISGLELRAKNLGIFGERQEEASEYITTIINSAKVLKAKQEKEDEEAVRIAKEVADAKARKEAEKKAAADAKEKADKEAADLELQAEKTKETILYIRDFFLDYQSSVKGFVEKIKGGDVPNIAWK